jgi:hypothetical protein
MSQLFVEAETKTNRHILAKINQQEATKLVIVSRLRAAGIPRERYELEDIKKSTI